MNYINCPNCKGEGRINSKICPICRGRGLYSWVGGFLLFWDKKFNKSQIAAVKLGRLIVALVTIVLFIFGFIGILCLARLLVPELVFLDRYWVLFAGPRGALSSLFWLSVLTDCYLYYHFERQAEERKKIWPKTTTTSIPLTDWNQAHRLAAKWKINSADALSPEADKLALNAWLLAEKLSNNEVLPIHLFAASLSSAQISVAINRLGLNWPKLNEKVAHVLAAIPKYAGVEPIFSRQAKEVMISAYDLACQAKKNDIDPSKILRALAAEEGPVKEILYDLEVGPDEVQNVSVWVEVYEDLRKEYSHFKGAARFKPKGGMNRAMTAIATPNLDNFSQDLTQIARAGYLGVCLDREKEYEEILRAIEGGRSSAVLVGPPGVGKTTIINGLVRRMVTEDVPPVLQDKRLVSLSLSSLIAGASQPGEVEQRFQMVLSEISRSGNIILFVPNIHNMIGVKTTEGELDISEILADVIKKRLLVVLATTTSGDYRKYIESKSLGEALQKIEVNEPDKNTTIQILEANAAPVESKEEVYFSYGSLVKAYDLSIHYIAERFLPDKTINLLKEVAVYVRSHRGRQTIVQPEDVAAVIAEKTKIPVTKITEQEGEKLLHLEDEIHKRMVDQDEAVKMVASSLRRARTELRDNKRPIVNLLFLGPTGVGKTELAKTVAEVYFGDENKMVRLDMSEYQTKESIYRLIGAPGGAEAGQLTEQVRQNPFTLLLLDEIEKAHPDILNAFLQVMDDGRLTDNLGRTVDFTNVILIATSNAGTDFIQEEISKNTPVAQIQDVLVREKLKLYFRPEFLNRFDGVIVFKPLGKPEIKQIAQFMINKLAKQMLDKGITLQATDEAISELADSGYDPLFGARPLRRAIQEKVNDSLANYLLTGKIGRRDVVVLDKGGQIRVEKGETI